MDSVLYDANLSGYGSTQGNTVKIGPSAATVHYPIHGDTGYTINNVDFGGNDVNGIDCTAEVVAHEKYHRWVYRNWQSGGIWYGQTDTDGDGLPDNYEVNISSTFPDSSDSYHVAIIRNHPPYQAYGDQEYMAMVTANGMVGDSLKDWSAGLYSKQWP